jgi:hypothetical protein
MSLPKDWIELLQTFNDANVEYLIVGAHAMAVHGEIRATRDLDIWIARTPENAARAYRALSQFGAPLHNLTVEELQDADLIYQIGVEPIRIDILTDIDGVAFSEAWANRVHGKQEETTFPTIGIDDLIKNKRTSGRPKDLLDIDLLEKRYRTKGSHDVAQRELRKEHEPLAEQPLLERDVPPSETSPRTEDAQQKIKRDQASKTFERDSQCDQR